MPWQTRFLEPERLVETVFSGRLPGTELRAAFKGSVTLAQERGTVLFLADCAALEGGHSVMDVFALLELFESLKLDRRVKEAILLSGETPAADKVEFYETACRNRGYMVRLFNAREEALRWLTG